MAAATAGQFQAEGPELLFQQAHHPGALMAGAQFAEQAGIGEKAPVPVEMVVQCFDARCSCVALTRHTG